MCPFFQSQTDNPFDSIHWPQRPQETSWQSVQPEMRFGSFQLKSKKKIQTNNITIKFIILTFFKCDAILYPNILQI